jgi:GNAT superfamily N-acetyltransferase
VKLRFVDIHAGTEGTRVAWAFKRAFPAPVASIFYRWVGGVTIELIYIHTLPAFRREGIMRELFQHLLEIYPPGEIKRVITEDGSVEGGEAWLVSQGFKRDPFTQDWIFDLVPQPSTQEVA